MKKISLFITSTLLVFSCNNKKQTYYQAPNGKVFTAQEYQEAKLKMSERGEIQEVILSSIERNDSIIKLFNTIVKEENPYAEIDKFIGEKLPFESLIDLTGNKFNLNSLNGKPTMVNLWFVNCPPCIAEIPELNRIKKNYGDRVNFLAVTFNNREIVNKFLSKTQFDFNHIIDAQSEIDKLNNNSYPLNLYLDKDGIIISYESMIYNDKKNGVNIELEKLL
jgi:cytochrome c biogenesis protein CcmG/thiol:disulfide interchange protein DsbE